MKQKRQNKTHTGWGLNNYGTQKTKREWCNKNLKYLEIVMEKGGKEKHYGTQKTKRESDWAIEEKKSIMERNRNIVAEIIFSVQRVSRKKGSNDHKVNEA